jgi:hypothetical protein
MSMRVAGRQLIGTPRMLKFFTATLYTLVRWTAIVDVIERVTLFAISGPGNPHISYPSFVYALALFTSS